MSYHSIQFNESCFMQMEGGSPPELVAQHKAGLFLLENTVNELDQELTKEQVLSRHLAIDEDEAKDLIESEDYLVLSDEEADERVAEYIKGSLWAFNASFIIEHSQLEWESEPMLKEIQEKNCESANPIIEALIDNIEDFIDDAISSDGRGHFISPYDGEEHEVDDYFIYRMN